MRLCKVSHRWVYNLSTIRVEPFVRLSYFDSRMSPFHGNGCKCPGCLKRKQIHHPKAPTPANLSLDASILATLAALQGGQVALSRQIQSLAASVASVKNHVESAQSVPATYYVPNIGSVSPPPPLMMQASMPAQNGLVPGTAPVTLATQGSVPNHNPLVLSTVTPTVSQSVITARPIQDAAVPTMDAENPEAYFDQMMG
ncbi:hypothetical protein PRIPAC_72812 [Pristionchus pacificus]|uniref:Uncharacterized protein n=1 Tax=Pristionchus pacificus TaxID=54126 RepID=A0A2A6CF90_PRIPA|nr:hypothetical protein PRIPAC_72177 [Pristionchus pacificus]KAF8383670.1 hypothetical protein PRIPAC_72812 [Pristionchus pacificus]|eukprot:PDM68481.1 hypothetical protein PRIPAC_43983 [Pristionchus pacificus]